MVIVEAKKEKYTSIIVILLLVLATLFYLHNLTGWLINDDEEGYLYQAWRISAGEMPYRDFYSPKSPLFLFTGGLIFKFFTPITFWVRLVSVLLTVFTGYLIFLIGTKVYSIKVSLLGIIFYFALRVVYFQARLYREDVYTVFFSTLGIFLFINAWKGKKKDFFFYAGISYGLAVSYKLFGIIGAIAIIMFILYQAIIERNFSIIKYNLGLFLTGFLGIIVPLFMFIQSLAPSFFTCIIGHHLAQPLSSNLAELIGINLKDIIYNNEYYFRGEKHYWLVAVSLLVSLKYLFDRVELRKVFTFVILSGGMLLINPYIGETSRYLLYLLPISILVFANFILELWQSNNIWKKVIVVIILLVSCKEIFMPSLKNMAGLFCTKEYGTLQLAQYVKENTKEKDYIMADYGSIPFYSRRRTTPLMAGMSLSAVEAGVITSDRLIEELNTYPVKMILIHQKNGIAQNLVPFFKSVFGEHHFKALLDSEQGPKFIDFINKHYKLVAQFNRMGQVFAIYLKNEEVDSKKRLDRG